MVFKHKGNLVRELLEEPSLRKPPASKPEAGMKV